MAGSLQFRRSGEKCVQTILLLGLLSNSRTFLAQSTVFASYSPIFLIRVTVHGDRAHDTSIMFILMLYFIVIDYLFRA